MELGLWEDFNDYAIDYSGLVDEWGPIEGTWDYKFTDWLIDPARFCQLAADFLKEREENGRFA